SYTDSGFDQDEQIRLKKSIDELTERGVKIMLSNSDTEFIKNLYSQDIYNIYKIEVYRNIASKNESRKVVSEVVITNY
ncbi:DNA adenine methylase, partial [Staphylococcus sp. EG-SA-6]|nr:DNA adenine methylase [Staphylococcus sp. EG-SA-6]